MLNKVQIGLVAANNLADLPDKNAALRNLGINRSSLYPLSGLAELGLKKQDFQAIAGSTGNFQLQINQLNSALQTKISKSGGTVAGNLVVNGTVQANLFLSPSGTPISTSTDSYWSTNAAGTISYGGSVEISGALTVGKLNVGEAFITDLDQPFYKNLDYTKGVGVGKYILPAAEAESLSVEFYRKSAINQINQQPCLTLTRASQSWALDSDGIIKPAAANSYAWEHDPLTRECLGVLCQPAATNLNPNSTPSSGWSVFGGSLLAGQGDSLIQGRQWVLLKEDTANGAHCIQRTFTGMTANAIYTFSFFVKPVGRTIVYCGLGEATFLVDVLSGKIVPTQAIYNQNLLNGNFKDYGNGIYRVWIVFSVQETSFSVRVGVNNSTDIYTGQNLDAILLDGLQLEENARPTSIIPTNGSTATRAADLISNSGALNWIASDQGTLFIEAYKDDNGIVDSQVTTMLSLSDGTANNNIALASSAYNGYFRGTVTVGGTAVTMTEGSFPEQECCIFGLTYGRDNANPYSSFLIANSSSVNSVKSDLSSLIPALTTLHIGSNQGQQFFNGIIKQVKYFPKYSASIVSGISLINTWQNRMISSYEQIHNHAPLYNFVRKELYARLAPGGYLSNTFQDRSIADFFYVLHSNGRLKGGVIAKTGLPLRWDINSLVYNQNNLPELSVPSSAIITVSSIDGFSGITSFNVLDNNLSGALPKFNLASSLYFVISLNQFNGRIPQLTSPALLVLSLFNNRFSGFLPLFLAPNLLILDGSGNQFSGALPNFVFPKSTFINLSYNKLNGVENVTSIISGSNNIKQFYLQSNRIDQIGVDAVLAQFHTHRNYLAGQSGNLELFLDIGNSAPSATGLANKAAIEAAFSAVGKVATIQVS